MSKRVGNQAIVSPKEKTPRKRSWRLVVIVSVIVAVLMGAFVGVGLLFEYQYRNEY